VALPETHLFSSDLEPYRRELTGYRYRMLGSGFEAEDAVQEAMLRAWRHADGFEGRSSVRSWLYRIATNVCIDMQRHVQRRARPMDMGPASHPRESLLRPTLPESTWVTPIPDSLAAPEGADPAEIAQYRDSVRLAFVTALQHLPGRQRAALILFEVLGWPAAEVAELLDTTVPAVNSALQRARATLAARPSNQPVRVLDGGDAELLDRYVDAFEHYDIERLVALLREDAVQSMPPFELWIAGASDIGKWMSRARARAEALGCCAPRPTGARHSVNTDRTLPRSFDPWALQVLEISDAKITGMHFFLSLLEPERLFPQFRLALHLEP
jgi:RNA polymerase sigma-70 factor (ECF subfamily)